MESLKILSGDAGNTSPSKASKNQDVSGNDSRAAIDASKIRIIGTYQSSALRRDGYLNQVKKEGSQHLRRTMQGVDSLNDLVHLRVDGKSQLGKELDETAHMKNIMYHKEALYRNEMNGETETKSEKN